MEINNPTQLAAFVRDNKLTTIDQVYAQLVQCIQDYAVGCNCHRPNDKASIYQNCTRLYCSGAMLAATRFRHEFLNCTTERQISFYTESGQLIAIASR